MTYWLRLDDGFPEHPKAIGLSDGAKALWLDALCYAHRARTDGHIPSGWVPDKRRRHAETLVNRRLWVPDPDEDGWLIHDYLAWNPSRASLEDTRKRQADAGRRGAEKRWGNPNATPIGEP